MKRSKEQTEKMIIKAEDLKVSIGHQDHFTGTGIHDNRPKRQRTRQTQRRAWQKECA